MSEATLTWLHLTDLHIGDSSHGFKPEDIFGLLVADVEQLLRDKRLPAPQLVFFTGDLVYSGLPSQYVLLDKLLERFWGWMESKFGHRPVLVPVPGNHDLSWQPLSLDELVLWRTFHSPSGEVRNQFFGIPSPPPGGYWLCERVTTAFAAYTEWLQTTRLPVLTRTCPGIVPGQYANSWESPDGMRVGVLGLNSAYYDLPFKERPSCER